MEDRICAYEGCTRGPNATRKVFTPKYAKHIYCIWDCYNDSRRGKKLDPALVARRPKRNHYTSKVITYQRCPMCKQQYEVKHAKQQFCSINCSNAFNAMRRRKHTKKRARSSSLVQPTKIRQAV